MIGQIQQPQSAPTAITTPPLETIPQEPTSSSLEIPTASASRRWAYEAIDGAIEPQGNAKKLRTDSRRISARK